MLGRIQRFSDLENMSRLQFNSYLTNNGQDVSAVSSGHFEKMLDLPATLFKQD